MAKVLIVDDSAFVRMRSTAMLAELGHEVSEAGDGAQAVAKFKADRPDVVLMDITMPVMDGLEALRAIMAYDPSARVAMVTAMGQQAVVMEAIKAGARDFVIKPFDPARVQAALERLVA